MVPCGRPVETIALEERQRDTEVKLVENNQTGNYETNRVGMQGGQCCTGYAEGIMRGRHRATNGDLHVVNYDLNAYSLHIIVYIFVSLQFIYM